MGNDLPTKTTFDDWLKYGSFSLFLIMFLVYWQFANRSGEKELISNAVVAECINYLGSSRADQLAMVELVSGEHKKVRLRDCREGAKVKVYKKHGVLENSSYYEAE